MRKAIAWTFAGQILSFVIQFGSSVVVARLLTPHEMGIFTVSIATIGILQLITTFGTGNYIVRATSLDDDTLATAFTLNACLEAALAVAILGLSLVGGDFLGDPGVSTAMRWLALVPFISIFEFRPATMLQREMRFKDLSLVRTAQTLIGAAVTVGSAYAGASYLSPAFGGIATALFGAIAYNVLGRQHVGWRLCKNDWRTMAAFGIRMMSIGGIASVATRVSDIILGHFLGLAALGLYGRANNLSNLIFQNLYGTASRVVFSKLSLDFRERGVVRDTYLPGLRMVTGVLGPTVIGLAILANPVIRGLYGPKWTGAAPVLSLLLVAQFISLSFSMNWELFVIRDKLALQTRLEIARSVCGVVTRSLGCLIGLVAASASSIVDALFSVWLYAPHINELADTRARELGRIYGETIVLTFVTTLPSLVLMIAYDWSPETPLALVGAAIAGGGILWGLMLQRTRHPLWKELTVIAGVGLGRLRGRGPLAPDR